MRGVGGCTVARFVRLYGSREHEYDLHARYGQCLVYDHVNHGDTVVEVRHIYKHMVRCMGQWLSVFVHSWKCVVVCMCMRVRVRVRMLIQHVTYDVCVHGYVGVAESRT